MDPENECALCGSGKADAFQIAEGSPEAIDVLKAVNTLTLSQLDVNAGLYLQAAQNIVAYRGSDFDTLTALDAVPWVGIHAFERLLEYAQAHGFVPNGAPSIVKLTWHHVTAHSEVGPSGHGPMVYDSAKGRAVVYEGSETWARQGNDWIQLADSTNRPRAMRDYSYSDG